MPFSWKIQPCAGGLRVLEGFASTVSSFTSISSPDAMTGATNSTSVASSTKAYSGFWGKPPERLFEKSSFILQASQN